MNQHDDQHDRQHDDRHSGQHDDLGAAISAALHGAGDTAVTPSATRFAAAVAAGGKRRQQKLMVAGGGAAAALVLVGGAVFAGMRGDDGPTIRTDDVSVTATVDSATPDSAVPVPTTLDTFPDEIGSTVDTTVSPTTTEPALIPDTTVLPTTVIDTTAPTPTVAPGPTIPPRPELPWVNEPRIAPTVVARFDPFDLPADALAMVSDDAPATVELRDSSALRAAVEIPCSPDVTCTVVSATLRAGSAWIAVEDVDADGGLARSRVLSIDAAAGEVVEEVVFVDGESGAAAGDGAREAAVAANGRLYVRFHHLGDRRIVSIENGAVAEVDGQVSGFSLSDDGRFLAVGFSDPLRGAETSIEVRDLVDGRVAAFPTPGINAGPGDWSPDGRFLIVDEQWESGISWAVDPWTSDLIDGTFDPEFVGEDYVGGILNDNVCFVDDVTVAHRTWGVGYGQGDAQPGTIRLRSLETGEVVDERGVDVFGDFRVRCHDDGSVSYLRRPVAEVEFAPGSTQLEGVAGPVELVRVGPDGTETVLDAGPLRFV